MRTITEEQKAKLIAINKLVENEEIKAVARYEILQKELEGMVVRKSIWDYNLDMKFCCFTSDETLNKKYDTEEGNSIYECNIISCEGFVGRKENLSWSEVDYFRGTILEGFQFCYTFYCVLCYSDLALEDILLLDCIWIEIFVDYQWEVNLERNS